MNINSISKDTALHLILLLNNSIHFIFLLQSTLQPLQLVLQAKDLILLVAKMKIQGPNGLLHVSNACVLGYKLIFEANDGLLQRCDLFLACPSCIDRCLVLLPC